MDQLHKQASVEPLTVKTFSNVVCMPLESTREDGFGVKFGAFSSDGLPLDQFRLRRFYGTSQQPDFQPTDDFVDDSVVYAGVILNHFGHFLLESLSRVWCHRELSTGSIVWHGWTNKLNSWQEYIIRLVGMPVERFSYVEKPTRFREIIVPDPGFQIGLSFHPLHAEALAAFPCGKPNPEKRIWLSRAKLPLHRGHVLEEAQIEQRLKERGWDIVYPETLPMAEQLEQIASAATVAGFEGSAFHALILLRDFNAAVRIVSRRKKPNQNFKLIASIKGLNQKILSPQLKVVSGKNSRTTWTLHDLDEVIDFVH